VSIHTCSYYCDRPECVLAQRDELRQKLKQAEKQWVGLTDYDIWEVFKDHDPMRYIKFSRAIEAKLKEKNHDTR
jgi:hypothetical protein